MNTQSDGELRGAEMDRLRKENARLRLALTSMIEECDRTLEWRQGGMRPATDTSAFAATSFAGVLEIKRRCEWALDAEPGPQDKDLAVPA